MLEYDKILEKHCRHCGLIFKPYETKCNYFCSSNCCGLSHLLTNAHRSYPECSKCDGEIDG